MKKQELIEMTKKTIKNSKTKLKGFESVMLWDNNEQRIHDYINRNNNFIMIKERIRCLELFLKELESLEE